MRNAISMVIGSLGVVVCFPNPATAGATETRPRTEIEEMRDAQGNLIGTRRIETTREGNTTTERFDDGNDGSFDRCTTTTEEHHANGVITRTISTDTGCDGTVETEECQTETFRRDGRREIRTITIDLGCDGVDDIRRTFTTLPLADGQVERFPESQITEDDEDIDGDIDVRETATIPRGGGQIRRRREQFDDRGNVISLVCENEFSRDAFTTVIEIDIDCDGTIDQTVTRTRQRGQ